MAMHGLYVPTNAPWYPDFLHELLSFPAAKHDDIVDGVLCDQSHDHTGEIANEFDPPEIGRSC
jgi:phage terminase large subunit-like protein